MQNLSEEHIAQFLRQHPDFFAKHPDLLATLSLENPQLGVVSLSQKQRERLTQKTLQLQQQLEQLIDNAHNNSALQSRMHDLSMRLMDCQSVDALLTCLSQQLQAEFKADDVAVRLFHSEAHRFSSMSIPANHVLKMGPDDAFMAAFEHVLAKPEPFCGRLTNAQKSALFAEQAEQIQSVACIPLGPQPCVGLLAIASTDPQRFFADMGTIYLQHLGDVFIRMLRRLEA